MNWKNGNKRFEFKLLGKAYPNALNQSDLEWYLVSMTVTDDLYSWSFEGPYLREKEIVDLNHWLEKLAKGKTKEIAQRIDFTEHEIAFGFDDKNFNIYFDLDAHPKGQQFDILSDKEYTVSMPMDNRQLQLFASYLSKLL